MDFHWLRLRATAHPTEDVEKVRSALREASGIEGERFDAGLRETALETHHGATQYLLELELRRNRDCRTALWRMMGNAADVVGETLEERVDDDGVLYLRLDKQEAFQGRLVVGTFDDPVSVRGKLQVHPASRANAIVAWRAFLSSPATSPAASPAL